MRDKTYVFKHAEQGIQRNLDLSRPVNIFEQSTRVDQYLHNLCFTIM